MSGVARRSLSLLKVLEGANPKLRKAIVKYASPNLVKAISEIVLNMLKGVITLTPQQRRKLSRYKKEFRTLAAKKIPVNKKRKLLVQKGGNWWAALIPLALTLLTK